LTPYSPPSYTHLVTDDQLSSYRDSLAKARATFKKNSQRVAEISREQLELRNENVKLRRTITALAAMCSDSPYDDSLGITESCLETFANITYPLTTAEAMDALERMGFDLAAQKNAAASVHAVLNRLATKGKITKVVDDSNNVTWRGPKYDPNWDKMTDEDIPF
jgi:hypothetical protein